MFEYIKLIILGIIEGITEFMPVSSTAHLILAQRWLSLAVETEGLHRILEIFPQVGCALAVLWFYRQKIFYLLKHMWTLRDAKLTVRNLVIATLPLLLAPIVASVADEQLNSVLLMAENLLMGAVIIFLLETRQHAVKVTTMADISVSSAILIGLAQLLAIFPGVSRSGATIVAALLLQIDRKTAVTFSFLLAIPAIMGAACLETIRHHTEILLTANLWMIVISTAAALVTALMVIQPLMACLSNRKLVVFGWYRVGLGLLLLLSLQWGWL